MGTGVRAGSFSLEVLMANNILFLGTGANDWLIEKRKKGMFFRRYTAALINGEVLIDCGPHIFDFVEHYGDPHLLDNVKTVVITHRHSDHFCPETLMKIAGDHDVTLVCDDFCFSQITDTKGIKRIPMPLYKKTAIGDYKFIALPANHDVRGAGKDARHFIITMPDDKELYYGLDGTWFSTSEWLVLKKHQCAVMVLDCTIGRVKDARVFEHNNMSMVRMMVKQIRKSKVLAPGGVIVGSHFSRKLMPSHFNTRLMLKCYGIKAAEDGMKIEF